MSWSFFCSAHTWIPWSVCIKTIKIICMHKNNFKKSVKSITRTLVIPKINGGQEEILAWWKRSKSLAEELLFKSLTSHWTVSDRRKKLNKIVPGFNFFSPSLELKSLCWLRPDTKKKHYRSEKYNYSIRSQKTQTFIRPWNWPLRCIAMAKLRNSWKLLGGIFLFRSLGDFTEHRFTSTYLFGYFSHHGAGYPGK